MIIIEIKADIIKRSIKEMGNEKYFDENVVLYDKFRPTYGTKIFEDILSYGRIKKSNKILEIGCGTGNATLPMIRTGAEVTAVEIGDNLSKYTAQKFSQYSNFHVIHSAFEDFQAHAKYDLIFAATAFHWIKPDKSYSKCKELLTAGGVLAVFWNTPRISRKNYDLYEKIQGLYQKFMPNGQEEKEMLLESEWYTKRCNELNNFLKENGYLDCIFKTYQDSRVFSADEYIGLLQTYSDHMALPSDVRTPFFEKIHSVINKHKTIEIIDTIDLHMGRV